MEIHTAIDSFEELRAFFNTKKETLDGKEIRIKVMTASNIVSNEEGYFINPDKIKTIELPNNENEITVFLFRNNNLSEVPMNAKTSFNITKDLWKEMRPKFIISYH